MTLQKISWSTIVIHPFLFAIFPLVFLFSFNIDILFPEEIIIPFLIVLLVSFVLWISLGFIFKNRIKSGFVVSIGIILFSSYGYIYVWLQSDVFQKKFPLHELLLSVFIALFIIGIVYFVKTKRTLNNATKIVNVIVVSLVLMSLVNIGSYYLTTENFSEETDVIIEVSGISENLPDIYYILLDEYGREDMLQKYLDFDNSGFISYLSDKGFYVSPNSMSNYARSVISIPSTLNMEYPHQNVAELGITSLNHKVLIQATSQNKVMEYLKSKGYTIISFNTGHWPTKSSKISDIHLCGDVNNFDSEFVPLYLRTTILNPIHVQFFAGDYRDRILCIFTSLSKIPENDEMPKFVFAHIMLPHRPYVFAANGEPIIPDAIYKGIPEVWDESRYLGQLQFVNKKMKETIDKILEEDEKAVILIQSDHGFRYDLGNSLRKAPTKELVLKLHNNFEAYYFPEKGRNLLLEETTNVNTFPIIFNLYLDGNFSLLPDKIYYSRNGIENIYNFTDVTNMVLSD